MATPTSLPASFTAGQVLTAAQQNDLRGAFRVLQVVSATTTTETSSSSLTYADITDITATITPQSATNKILVVYMTAISKTAANSQSSVGIRFVRDATVIATWADSLYQNSAVALFAPFTGVWLDSPATTSATTYKAQIANGNVAAAQASAQSLGAPGQFILMEISA
jgi:hypothetical protein